VIGETIAAVVRELSRGAGIVPGRKGYFYEADQYVYRIAPGF